MTSNSPWCILVQLDKQGKAGFKRSFSLQSLAGALMEKKKAESKEKTFGRVKAAPLYLHPASAESSFRKAVNDQKITGMRISGN